MALAAFDNVSFALAKTPFAAGLRLEVFRVDDRLVVPAVFVDVFFFAADGLAAEVFFAGVFFLGAAAFLDVAFFVVAFFVVAFLVVVDFFVVGFRFVVGIPMLLVSVVVPRSALTSVA